MLLLKFSVQFTGAITILVVMSAEAKSLACWNAYSRFGAKPVLTAQILKHDKLQKINVNEMAYKAYSLNPSMNRSVSGKEILNTSNRFNGKREFGLSQGARLILPLQLSKKILDNTLISKNSSKKSNGVLILPFKNENKKIKDYTYIPMMCQEII